MQLEAKFTEGKIFGQLVRFALPVLAALCLQAMYGAVDLLIVGQFSTAANVSAVSTGSQMMHMLTTVITALAMGTTIMLGQAIGNGRSEEAGRIIGNSITIFAVLAAAVTTVVLLFTRQLAMVMQAPAEAFEATVGYIRICAAGTLFIVAYNVLGSVFRGLGDSRTPLMTVAFACVFNIAGDLIFVAVLDMAAEGAALATVMAQGLSVLLCLVILRKRGMPVNFRKEHLRPEKNTVGRMLRLGFPVALQEGLVGISFLVIAAIVNSLGVIPSAGVGVAEKVCSFIMLVPSSFSQALSAFVAQNIGAGKPARARRAMAWGMGASLAVGILMFSVTFFRGDLLAAIFTADRQVVLAAADYLKAYAIDTMIVAFLFCYIGYFNGCGKTTLVMVQGIVGAFGVRIPVSWFMSRLQPVSLFHIGLATPCSTVMQIILCTAFFLWMLRQERTRAGDGGK
ncbi:MAG: MATE family efflux transporter [Anaerovoracaceae bacterium]